MLDWSRVVEFARRLAPHELASRPIYVVRMRELPAELGRPKCTAGYTSGVLDQVIRPYLGNRWQGRGPAIVIKDDFYQGLHASAADRLYLHVLLHELAHVIELMLNPEYLADEAEPSAEEVELRRTVIAKGSAREEGQSETGPRPRCQYHGPRFIRAGLHLVVRSRHLTPILGLPAKRGPQITCWNDAVNALQELALVTGTDVAEEYRDALGAEPIEYWDQPLPLTRPPPPRFAAVAAREEEEYQREISASANLLRRDD